MNIPNIGDIIKFKFLFNDNETIGESYAEVIEVNQIKSIVKIEYDDKIIQFKNIISVYKKEI